jgi:origin recognition complex subunit 1
MALQDCQASGQSRVKIEHVNKVIKNSAVDPAVLFLPSLSIHEKIFLCALLQRVRKNGLGEAVFAEVFDQHLYLCKQHQLSKITQSDAEELASELADINFIIVESRTRGLTRKLKPNINEEELANILKADEDIKDLKLGGL